MLSGKQCTNTSNVFQPSSKAINIKLYKNADHGSKSGTKEICSLTKNGLIGLEVNTKSYTVLTITRGIQQEAVRSELVSLSWPKCLCETFIQICSFSPSVKKFCSRNPQNKRKVTYYVTFWKLPKFPFSTPLSRKVLDDILYI